jgi:hypothetical protein
MSDPFTLRIFVPSGDPEGVRIVDRMNSYCRPYELDGAWLYRSS